MVQWFFSTIVIGQKLINVQKSCVHGEYGRGGGGVVWEERYVGQGGGEEEASVLSRKWYSRPLGSGGREAGMLHKLACVVQGCVCQGAKSKGNEIFLDIIYIFGRSITPMPELMRITEMSLY